VQDNLFTRTRQFDVMGLKDQWGTKSSILSSSRRGETCSALVEWKMIAVDTSKLVFNKNVLVFYIAKINKLKKWNAEVYRILALYIAQSECKLTLSNSIFFPFTICFHRRFGTDEDNSIHTQISSHISSSVMNVI
jgi:hypothetical protein